MDEIEQQIRDLGHQLEVSRRIVERPFRPHVDGNEIIHTMVVGELDREIPRLEAKISWLTSELDDRRSTDEKDLEPA